MRKLTPHLWFDRQAVEAAKLYTSVFPDSTITHVTTIHDTPSGDADVVSFELASQPFMAISAGPHFAFNPSVSFLVACDTVEEVDTLWGKLSEGGTPLMDLGAYPFSRRYGWTTDRYGLSWQVAHADRASSPQRITPTLMFTGEVCGRAEEAIGFYTSVFPDSKIGDVARYGNGAAPDLEGTVKHARFTLGGQQFAAMDSVLEHGFGFNEAISFMVDCDTQHEIDYYWGRLSAVAEAEQCGWLKDRYGLSWQIVPSSLDDMLRTGTEQQVARVTQAFLAMTKFDLSALEHAYQGSQETVGGTR